MYEGVEPERVCKPVDVHALCEHCFCAEAALRNVAAAASPPFSLPQRRKNDIGRLSLRELKLKDLLLLAFEVLRTGSMSDTQQGEVMCKLHEIVFEATNPVVRMRFFLH